MVLASGEPSPLPAKHTNMHQNSVTSTKFAAFPYSTFLTTAQPAEEGAQFAPFPYSLFLTTTNMPDIEPGDFAFSPLPTSNRTPSQPHSSSLPFTSSKSKTIFLPSRSNITTADRSRITDIQTSKYLPSSAALSELVESIIIDKKTSKQNRHTKFSLKKSKRKKQKQNLKSRVKKKPLRPKDVKSEALEKLFVIAGDGWIGELTFLCPQVLFTPKVEVV